MPYIEFTPTTGGTPVDVSSDYPMPMTAYGVQSAATDGNNSTDTLDGGATFTGTGELNFYPEVLVNVQSSSDGTLFFDFSQDDTNWSTFPVNGFSVNAGVNEIHRAVKGPRYFRVRFVNGSTAQTYMRLKTWYGTFGPLNSPLNQSIGLDSDAALTRPSNFNDEVRLGRRSGVVGFTKFGYMDNLTAASGYETIWPSAVGSNFVPQSAAETYDITYNNTTDGLGQNGALTLAVTYIDGTTGEETTTIHTLGNTGSDTTSFSGYGINRVAVASSGSSDLNTNAITFTGSTSGNVAAYVAAGDSVTEQAIYTVGANADAIGKLVWINVGKGSGGGSPKVRIRGRVYNRNVDTYYNVFGAIVNTATEQTISLNEEVGFNFSPTDVVFFEADTDTNGAEVYFRFSLRSYERT